MAPRMHELIVRQQMQARRVAAIVKLYSKMGKGKGPMLLLSNWT